MYRDLCQSVRQTLADGYTMDDLLEGLAHEDTLERLNQSQIGPVVDGNECGLLPETTPSPTGSSVGIVAGDAFESNPVSLRPDHDRMYRDLRQSVRQTLADGNAMDGMPEGLVHKERLERLKDNVRTFIQESMTAMTYDQKQDLLSMYREKYNRIDDLIQKRVSCAAQPKKRSLFGRVFGKNRKDLPKDDVEETRILETQNILNLLTLQVIASNTSSIF
ncbi:MAG: hypothetical protein KVP17_004746 [Porospora cf. gigantea B]|nr:MAG: hypothetical protein KVP17_004746 [Porospora cf. gigantea B]